MPKHSLSYFCFIRLRKKSCPDSRYPDYQQRSNVFVGNHMSVDSLPSSQIPRMSVDDMPDFKSDSGDQVNALPCYQIPRMSVDDLPVFKSDPGDQVNEKWLILKA